MICQYFALKNLGLYNNPGFGGSAEADRDTFIRHNKSLGCSGKTLLPLLLSTLNIINMDINKQALVDMVHGKLGGTKVQAEEIVEGIIGAIVDTLKKGGEVSIAGLGIFSVKQRAARTARNPKTGASVQVPATKVPKFRAAKALKEAVK